MSLTCEILLRDRYYDDLTFVAGVGDRCLTSWDGVYGMGVEGHIIRPLWRGDGCRGMDH